MTNCWYCGHEIVWNADFDFEDYGLEGEGVVSILSCSGCECISEFYQNTQNRSIIMQNKNKKGDD